jgi:hypothetical protein
MSYKVAEPHLKRSEAEWENPYFDRIYAAQQLERAVRKEARRRGKLASWAKVMLIFFGALTASKPALDTVLGPESWGKAIFALIGVLTASAAGLLTAFKWDEASGRLLILASQMTSWVREFETHWEKQVLYKDSSKIDAAIAQALSDGDQKLREFEQKAAESQVVVEQLSEPVIEHLKRGWNTAPISNP